MPPVRRADRVTPPSAGWGAGWAAPAATIAQYGGRYLTRGGAAELIEGGPEPRRVVILEFADVAAVERWDDSPEYQKILPTRLAHSTGPALIVQGVGLLGHIRPIPRARAPWHRAPDRA